MTINEDLAGGRLTIDLAALVRNWKLLAKHAGDAECGAVVKANAYGCGIEETVRALSDAGCRTFFVAMPTEGIRVRNKLPDAACYVLNGLAKSAMPSLIDAGLRPVLGSMHQCELWAGAAKSTGRALPCALHMDSGMNRLGLSYDQLSQLTANSEQMRDLDVRLFMTHFACADDIDHPKTAAQRELFEQGSLLLPGVPRSAANSAASLQLGGLCYDLARPGVALYGAEALNNAANPMEPVVTLEGRIIQIRNCRAGDSVGYGAAETLTRDSRLAYLSVGYADGYFRSVSNMGVPMRAVAPAVHGFYRGRKLKGIGRISMDLCAFDVTDVPENEIAEGDWIELFGKAIALDDVARAAGTIGYELLTNLGQRYSRHYLPVF